ncbi:MAG: hypothetical protein RMM58_12355 [Chloroflexota bacterium]|nr:hypothetical protein [Dehalococcoidia bacterium]MDW8254660.1 hypothetical protein [Chloroflexota bacterium]
MGDGELTSDEVALIRALRRYLALNDPLGERATLPTIVRYMALLEADDAAAQRGERWNALAYRLQRRGLEKQSLLSRLVTAAVVFALLFAAAVAAVSAWRDVQRILPAVQSVVRAATSPDFSKVETSLLLPDLGRGRLAPDPQGAFAPVVDDTRRRAELRLDDVRSAVTSAVTHAVGACAAGFGAIVVGVVQPHDRLRRWLLPLVGGALLRVGPGQAGR